MTAHVSRLVLLLLLIPALVTAQIGTIPSGGAAGGGGAVGGASNLTTVGAIPYVSSSGVLNQDATKLFWDTSGSYLYAGGYTNSSTYSVRIGPAGTELSFRNGSSSLTNSGTTTVFNTTQAAGYTFNDTGFNAAMSVKGSTGNLLIGGTTDDTVNKLQVTGYIKSTGISLGAAAATVEGIGFNRRVSDGVIFNSAHAATQFTNNNPTGTAMFEVYNGAGSFVGRSFGMFLASANSIVGTGNTSDGGYRLDITHSGPTGTLRVYDQTATTGSTLAVIQAGAGQSGNLLIVNNNAGTAQTIIDSGYKLRNSSGTVNGIALGTGNIVSGTNVKIGWSDSTDTDPFVAAIGRFGTGKLEINSGTFIGTTPGNARDLLLRRNYVVETTSDPSASDLTIAGSNAEDVSAIYMKNDKLVIAYNRSGTVTYLTIPLDGATTSWTQSTTAP